MPDLVVLQLSPGQRVALDGYLSPFRDSRDATLADLAGRCRQALNVRAVALGRAHELEEIAFTKDEYAFLVDQITATRDALGKLLAHLNPPQPEAAAEAHS